MTRRARRALRPITAAALAAAVGCSVAVPPQPAGDRPTPAPTSRTRAEGRAVLSLRADSGSVAQVAPGVVQHSLFRSEGPWAIHILDVDRDACWIPAAMKAGDDAVGRERTSALLQQVRTTGDTVAAVNADFFLFAPPGVPTGAHIDDGRVLTGPGVRPVFSIDRAGRLRFGRLRVRGRVVAAGDTMPLSEWNHLPVTRLGAFDERFGVWTDSTTGSVQVMVSRHGTVVGSLAGAKRASIPRGGWVLAAGRNAPDSIRTWLARLKAGDSVRVHTALAPFHPREAVGGFPMIVRDSAPAAVLDSANTQGLGKVRHPRTAIGIGRDGRRVFLVVVDGRQPGYSVGMTLPELAQLMLEMGAQEALNLDGGGSSAMAIRRSDGTVSVVNRPSDAGGERAVGNSLAIVKGGCG